MNPKRDVLEIFANARNAKTYVKISAPMVRYSKLEYRALLRRNKVDLCFTPMIVADSFCQSDSARQNEFTTNADDDPLIVQFAAKDTIDLLTAAELVSPYANGVDLNCGCPQKWAISSGYGCATLRQPELLRDMLLTLRRNLPSAFTASVKLRLLQKDHSRSTVDLCRTIEHCGASFVTVHGRTPWQKTCEPVDMIALRDIKDAVQIPVIANGDIKSLHDADEAYAQTNCDGMMAARGILTNPALFTGATKTPVSCIEDWIVLAQRAANRMTFQCFHHHITFMTEKLIRRRHRVALNNLTRQQDVIDFLAEHLGVNVAREGATAESELLIDYLPCTYDDRIYSVRKAHDETNYTPKTPESSGKFFSEHVLRSEEVDEEDDFCSMAGKSIFEND